MTTIEKLASALEDISIKDDTKEDEPQYVLPLEVDSESSLEDQQFEKLLDLIDQYESLSGGSFRLNHTNGRLNLTRANYNTGLIGKKYGYDAYDLRCYGSCKAVRLVNGEFKIIDKLKEKRERDRREKDTEKEKEKGKKRRRGRKKIKLKISDWFPEFLKYKVRL